MCKLSNIGWNLVTHMCYRLCKFNKNNLWNPTHNRTVAGSSPAGPTLQNRLNTALYGLFRGFLKSPFSCQNGSNRLKYGKSVTLFCHYCDNTVTEKFNVVEKLFISTVTDYMTHDYSELCLNLRNFWKMSPIQKPFIFNGFENK